MKNNSCKRVSTDRKAVEMLSRENPEVSIDRWSIENLSSRQRAQKISSMDREAIENLLRRNPKPRWIEILSRSVDKRRKKGLIEENLSRICREVVELEENVFSKGEKTHKDECNK